MRSSALMTRANALKPGEPTTTQFAHTAHWGNCRRTNSGNCMNWKPASQLTYEWRTRLGKVNVAARLSLSREKEDQQATGQITTLLNCRVHNRPASNPASAHRARSDTAGAQLH